MQEERTPATAVSSSMLVHVNDNQGQTHANTVDDGLLLAAVSHSSLLRTDGCSTGEGSPTDPYRIHNDLFQGGEGGAAAVDAHKSVRHSSRVPPSATQLGRAGESCVGAVGGEPCSPISFTRRLPAGADPAAVSYHASAAPTLGSEDSCALDGGRSLLLPSLYIHSPTAEPLQDNDNTVQNSSVVLSTHPQQQPKQQSSQHHPSHHRSHGPVVPEGSSSSHSRGIRVRPYAVALQQSCVPAGDGAFLTVVSVAKDRPTESPPLPSRKPGGVDAEVVKDKHHRSRSKQLGGDADEPGSCHSKALVLDQGGCSISPVVPSSLQTSPSSSVSSVPYSTAETQCHEATVGNDQIPLSQQLPLPASIEPPSPPSSDSSFAVSLASTMTSPCQPTHSITTHEDTSLSTQDSKISHRSKAASDQQHRSTAQQCTTSVNESTDSPLISLEKSRSNRQGTPEPSTPRLQQPSPIQLHSKLQQPPPRPSQVISGSGSGGRGKTAPAQGKPPVVSASSGSSDTTSSATATITSSRHSILAVDSASAGYRGSNLAGTRMAPADWPMSHGNAPQPSAVTSPAQQASTASSPQLAASLASCTRLSSTTSTQFAHSSSFGLPAFLNASNASLVTFPKLDVSMHATMAGAAATPSLTSGAAATGETDDDQNHHHHHVEGVAPATAETRHSQSPPLPSARADAPLQAANGSSTATAGEGRNSKYTLRSDGHKMGSSSFHSPSAPPQNSRGFTVTSTSLALEPSWHNAHPSRSYAFGHSSIHDSAISLCRSSSMLSETALQTLAHGMALAGAPVAPWYTTHAEGAAAAPLSPSSFPTRYDHLPGSPSINSDFSLCGSRNSNKVHAPLSYLPSSHLHHFPQRQRSLRRQASRAVCASTAAGVVFPLQNSFLSGASSYLSESAVVAPTDLHGCELRPFLTCTSASSATRSQRANPMWEPPTVDPVYHIPAAVSASPLREAAVLYEGGGGARHSHSHTTPSSTRLWLHSAQSPRLPQQQQRPGPGSFFAAVDGVPQCWGDHPDRSCTGDGAALAASTSLLTPHGIPPRRTTAVGTAAPDSPLQPRTAHCMRRSVAASSAFSAGSATPSGISFLDLYGTKSTDASESEHLLSCRCSSGAAERVWRGYPEKVDRGSGVARRRLLSGDFSGGFSGSGSHARAFALAGTPAEAHATFLQSVHAAAVNAAGAPAGCSFALRHTLMSSSSATPSWMAASAAFFSRSPAGSTGGRGVFRGNGLSTETSMAVALSSNASSETQLHSVEQCDDSAFKASTMDASSAKPVMVQPNVENGNDEKGNDVLKASCSLVSSSQPGPQLPQPLKGTTDTSGGVCPAGKDAVECVFGDDVPHLLPLVVREHSSMSTSSRLPTLRFLASSTCQCRVERTSEQMGLPRQPPPQHSTRAPQVPTLEIVATTTHDAQKSTHSPLQRSKPFASTCEGSDAPQPSDSFMDPEDGIGHHEEMAKSAPPTAAPAEQPAGLRRLGSLPGVTVSLSKNPLNLHAGGGYSQPFSNTANRGLRSPELTQRFSRPEIREARRNVARGATAGVAQRTTIPDVHDAVVGLRSVAVTATPASDEDGRTGHIIQTTIPSFHRHHDVDSMLDDAESLLRRVPVAIIPVLESSLTRGLDPNLSSTMRRQSWGSNMTSVLSLQTTARTASATGSDMRCTSDSTASQEKEHCSREVTDVSFTT
jgi:hypothetical protein